MNGGKLKYRGSVAHAHPKTIIGKPSRLAHTLKIDLLRDISTSMFTCRSYEICAVAVGAASCRDRLNWHQTPVFSGQLVQKVYNALNSHESIILARRPACIRSRDVQ